MQINHNELSTEVRHLEDLCDGAVLLELMHQV